MKKFLRVDTKKCGWASATKEFINRNISLLLCSFIVTYREQAPIFFSLFAALLAHAEFSQWVKRLKHEVTCCKVAVRRAMCHVVYNDHSLSKVKTFGRFKELFWQGCHWASMVHGLSDKPNVVVSDLHQGFFHTHTESNFRHCSHHSKSHKRGCFLWLLLELGCRLKSLK